MEKYMWELLATKVDFLENLWYDLIWYTYKFLDICAYVSKSQIYKILLQKFC